MSLQVTNTLTGEKYYLEHISKDCAKKYTYLGKKNITDETSLILHKPTEYHTYTDITDTSWVCDFNNIGGMIEAVKKGRINGATEMNPYANETNPDMIKLKIIRRALAGQDNPTNIGYASIEDAMRDLSHSGCQNYFDQLTRHSGGVRHYWHDKFINGDISHIYYPAKESCIARGNRNGNNICTPYAKSDLSMTWNDYTNSYLDMSICIASSQHPGFLAPLWKGRFVHSDPKDHRQGQVDVGHISGHYCIPSLSCDLSYTEDCSNQSTKDCSNYYQFDSCGIPYICHAQGTPTKKCKMVPIDPYRCYKSDNSSCPHRSPRQLGCTSVHIGGQSTDSCNKWYENDLRNFSAYTCVSGDTTCQRGHECTPPPAPTPNICKEGEWPVAAASKQGCYYDASKVCNNKKNSNWNHGKNWPSKGDPNNKYYFICSIGGETLTKDDWFDKCNKLQPGDKLCINCSGSCLSS